MAPNRYNLRSKSGKLSPDFISADPETSQTLEPDPPAVTSTSSTSPASTASTASPTSSTSSTADTHLLYQKPQKWTLDHLKIANLNQETNVPIEKIVDAKYIPSDSDPEFRRIVDCLRNPAKEDAHPLRTPDDISNLVPYREFYRDLSRYKWSGGLTSTNSNIWVPTYILLEMFPDESLSYKDMSRLPLSISALNAGRGIWIDGSIFRYSEDSEGNRKMGIPLAVISRKQETGDLGMARYEIPHLLLQANMVFNYDESFDQYEAFVISIEKFTYTFVRAVMSPEYLRSIRAGKPACGNLKVLRSESFDIVDRDARKEFLRGMMGLCRYFIHRPEFSFPMHKYRRVG